MDWNWLKTHWKERLRDFAYEIDESNERPSGFRVIVRILNVKSKRTGARIAGWGENLEEAAIVALSRIPEET